MASKMCLDFLSNVNLPKTKLMIIETQANGRVQVLDNKLIQVTWNRKPIEQAFNFELLGMLIYENFEWIEHINETVKECFTTLKTFLKMQQFSPLH